jgi:hypothetical protein
MTNWQKILVWTRRRACSARSRLPKWHTRERRVPLDYGGEQVDRRDGWPPTGQAHPALQEARTLPDTPPRSGQMLISLANEAWW